MQQKHGKRINLTELEPTMLTAEQVLAAHKANVETLFGLTNKAFEGVEKLVELNLQVAKTALTEAADTTSAALSVKDAQELLSLQAALLQPTAEKAASYSRHLYDIASSTGSEVGKDELLREADHLVLVLPYSAESHHCIGAAELALMKPTATIVNVARGGIVDEDALAAALREHRIAAAGLDVFEGEPRVNPALLTLPNVVLTPHIASATLPTRRAMATLAADNLIATLAGRTPPTPLNPEVLSA